MDANVPSSAPVTPPTNAAPAPEVRNLGLKEAINEATGKNKTVEAKGAVPPVPAAAPAEVKDAKEVKAAVEKIKLKNAEYTPEELESLIEKAKGADKKFLEASKKSKEAIRFFKMAKENPREFLAKTGLDPKKFAYDEVAEDLKNKLRDPKEVELENAQKRLQEYEKKEAEAKERAKAEKLQREAKAFEQKLHGEMIEALETFPELPKNGFTVAALARAIDTVREKTGQLLSAKEVAPMVVKDIRNMVQGVVKGSSAEQLIALIGEEGMKAIRAYDIAQLKNPMANGQTPPAGDAQERQAKKKQRSHDFWKGI